VSRTARSPRRFLRPSIAVVAAALAISGCASGQIAQTAQQVAAIDGGNGRIGHIGVLNALLAKPAGADYRKGTDAALQLWIANDGLADDTLATVETPAASKVSISGPAVVPGQSLKDFTGQTVKITLQGLTRDITFGQSVPMTFTFRSAGTVTINVPVETPDARTTGRPSINIQPSEELPLWETGEKKAEGATGGGENAGNIEGKQAPPTAGG